MLRSGGEYGAAHVQALQRQVARWAPDAEFACLTDTDVPGVETLPLVHKWPGWWSKLELFRADLGGFLFSDIDNVIAGPIDGLFTGRYTTQRLGWNALMYVPKGVSVGAYEVFRERPEYFMELFDRPCEGRPHGDAAFVVEYMGRTGKHWEDVAPGQVVNIVEMIRPTPLGPRWKPVPPDARVVLCATPQRRPWNLPMFRHLYEEKS